VVLLAYASYFLVIKKWQWPDDPRLGAAMFSDPPTKLQAHRLAQAVSAGARDSL
jgi:hypothetical protein